MNLLIRADASIEMGTGHVMRCLALAQAWQDAGGTATFATTEITGAMRKRLLDEGCQLIDLSCASGSTDDAKKLSAFAQEYRTDWVVVDGYQFKDEYQRAIKDAGCKLLFLDDYGHAEHYYADLVLNQNLNANANLYSAREPYSRLLLGTKYCLLRREFAKWREWKRDIPPVVRNVLVTMGGSDPNNFSLRILHALAQVRVDRVRVKLVVGGSNPHRASLAECARTISDCVELLDDIHNMSDLMVWADAVVGGAGTASWEICALGLPALLIPVAENQMATAAELGHRGAAHVLSAESRMSEIANAIRDLILNPGEREKKSQIARSLVDGEGSRRVVAALSC